MTSPVWPRAAVAFATGIGAALALATPISAQLQLAPGEGEFTYIDTGRNSTRPVRVLYAYPPSFDTSDHPRIVFVLHGIDRDAEEQRERFRIYADVHDALILCPEFTLVDWPGDEDYAQGNVRDGSGSINARADWSFSTIREIFDLVVAAVPNPPAVFDCQGHSAGAQFVHRMALMMPDAPIGRLVAANAGWYLLPDLRERYPNGVSNVGVSTGDLAVAFARELTVTLGTLDNDPNAPYLNHSSWAERQGPHRYARGHYFYDYCRGLAASLGLAFHWKIVDVDGVGHEGDRMVPAAVDALFGTPALSLLPADDTYVTSGSSNHGSDGEIRVDGNSIKTAYLKFDLRSLAGVTIDAAALRVHVTDGSAASQTVRAVADNGWDEHTLTYANRPASREAIGTGHGGSQGATTLIALADYVRAHRGGVISFSIESGSSDGLYFSSKESADPPELVIWQGRGHGQPYGPGTPGTGGVVPALAVPRAPVVGGALELQLAAAAANRPAVWVVGLGRAAIPVIGVTLLVDPATAVFWPTGTDGQGEARASLAVPDDRGLDGVVLDLQAIVVDPGGPHGFAASRGVEVVLRP